MQEIFLPVLSHFQNGNFWTASGGRMRCRVIPKEGILAAEVWEGPWCYQLSRVEEARDFPLDGEGLSALAAWLGEWQERINARPAKSLEETIQARDAVRSQEAAPQGE